MKLVDIMRALDRWDARGRQVFTHGDLIKIFNESSPIAFNKSILRCTTGDNPILARACRGIYVNMCSRRPYTHVLEAIASRSRPGHFTYVSLESALSEANWISQIQIKSLTCVTTGRRGLFNTPFGKIELVHTNRTVKEFADRLQDRTPLPVATPELAYEDLKRSRRNLDMVIPDIEVEAEGALTC